MPTYQIFNTVTQKGHLVFASTLRKALKRVAQTGETVRYKRLRDGAFQSSGQYSGITNNQRHRLKRAQREEGLA